MENLNGMTIKTINDTIIENGTTMYFCTILYNGKELSTLVTSRDMDDYRSKGYFS